MCHFTLQFGCAFVCEFDRNRGPVCVCVCSRALACVYVGGLAFWPRRGSPTAFGRGANWRGAPPPRRVLSEHEGRWINKSWGSKFCHMSGHVFPSSSWEQRPPAPLTRCWQRHWDRVPAKSKRCFNEPRVVRRAGLICEQTYLAERFHIVQTRLELMVLIPLMLKILGASDGTSFLHTLAYGELL